MFPCASLATPETASKYGLERVQLLVMRLELAGQYGDVNSAEPIYRQRRRDRPTPSEPAARGAADTVLKLMPA